MKQHISLFNYSIHNQADDTLDVNIDGYIVDAPTQEIMKAFWGDETSVSFKSIRDQIKGSQAKTVNFIVNSCGGHVGDAMAIHDLMDELRGKGIVVNTKGTGIVASAATFLVMGGGENSSMTENSWFMIHNVGGGIFGDVNVVENYARMMRKFNDQITGFYSKATGLTNSTLGEMMNKETWLTAQEAKEKGFIKNISGKAKITNKIKTEQWPFENTAILNTYNAQVEEPAQKDSVQHTFFSDLKNEFMKVFDSLKTSITGAKTDKKFEAIENRDAILDMVEQVLKPVVDAIDAKIKDEKEEVKEEVKEDKKEEKKEEVKEDKTTSEDAKAEIERLKAENKKLKAAAAGKATKPEEDTDIKNSKKYAGVKIQWATDDLDTDVEE